MSTKLTVVNCRDCGIKKRNATAYETINLYCDVCQSMLEALQQTPYFSIAHDEWFEENSRRVEIKKRIMDGGKEAA
jgi:hypothetical protein